MEREGANGVIYIRITTSVSTIFHAELSPEILRRNGHFNMGILRIGKVFNKHMNAW